MKKIRIITMTLAVQIGILVCDLLGQGSLDFVGSPTNGTVPLIVQFTATVSLPGTITSISWSFGDGGTSSVLNPRYTYTTAGRYTVRLKVYTTLGHGEVTKINYIDATPPGGWKYGWIEQSSGTTSDLWAVSFTDADTGTTVGSNGTILRTTNGGVNWTTQTSGTSNLLFGVSFTDVNTGTAVGDKGTILRTTDGGLTWTSQSSRTTNVLRGVCFVNANAGTAVGGSGIILHTTDGGVTWTSQASGTTNSLCAVSFVDVSTGIAVGSRGIILRTTNGGVTWTNQPSGTTNTLFGVSLADVSTGIAVGDNGTILRTTDGGLTWARMSSGTTDQLCAVSVADANTGTAVGSRRKILRTANGGLNWTNQPSGTALTLLLGVSMTNANTGTVVGTGGTILRTTTGGVVSVRENQQAEIPMQLELSQNYPNPFNPETTIKYQLPEPSEVTIRIFNVTGQVVKTILEEHRPAGYHSILWNGKDEIGLDVASGVYFYQFRAKGSKESFVQTRKMLLLR